ncbi:MAG: DUF2339 domain-containing protein [Candidatus Ratteibacteria bacterium]|nr:DUF2339 domain-containing protein [Candidatus Ratteibacteria bacterium]
MIPEDIKKQFDGIERLLSDLQKRIERMELLIADKEVKPATKTLEDMRETDSIGAPIRVPPVRKEEAVVREKGPDVELIFGKNWLNKIGIVILTLGVGFLISYTFKYFGPVMKIGFGYLVSAILFFLGFRLEAKEKFVNFGRVLLGGGWALVYFTTYAMHHFDASRIIQSQIVDLIFLAAVVIGMMIHVLKYKSENMMSLTLFIAYLTATLGQITGFTIISCMLLSVVILFLVYNFKWVKTFILGIILTYAIHYIWVMPNVAASIKQTSLLGIKTADYHLLMNLIFLTVYWLIFLAGAHIARTFKDLELNKILSAINFGNIALYSILSYPLILKLFYNQRFAWVLIMGLIYLFLSLAMRKIGREKLYISDIVAAVFLITISVPLKFLPTSTLLIWLIEVPFLLFVGIYFKDRIFRYLSYALSICVAFWLIFLSCFEKMADVNFFGLIWTWQEFMLLWATVSMAVSFCLIQRTKNSLKLDKSEEGIDHVFSAASWIYLTLLILSIVEQPWISIALSVEALVLLGLNVALQLKRFRVYIYLVLLIAALIFIIEGISVHSVFLKWGIISINVFVFFAIYFSMKCLQQSKKIILLFEKEEQIAFWGGVILLTYTIFQYSNQKWISLSLGIASVLIILMGILDKNKIERLGGLVMLMLTLWRVVFIDLGRVDMIFKIITFIVLGVLFVAVSYLYNRYNTDISQGKGKAFQDINKIEK